MVSFRLGQDSADAALNRPVLILNGAELEALPALVCARETPALHALLAREGAARRGVGAGGLPGLRRELRRLLDAMPAAQLPGRLTLALTLQRLDTACATAQEFGFNLYLTFDDTPDDD